MSWRSEEHFFVLIVDREMWSWEFDQLVFGLVLVQYFLTKFFPPFWNSSVYIFCVFACWKRVICSSILILLGITDERLHESQERLHFGLLNRVQSDTLWGLFRLD